MAGRLSRNIRHQFKARLYSTQAAVASTPKSEQRTAAALAKEREVQVESSKATTLVSFNRNLNYQNVVLGFKAGSKYEDPSTLGMSHVLRHVLQLSTSKISWLELIDLVEINGASLRFTSSRDNFYCILTGYSSGLPALTQMVQNFIQRKNFDEVEFKEYNGLDVYVRQDLQALEQQPDNKLVELLHGAAFYGGLGNSLYSTPNNVGNITPENVVAWTNKYCSGNMVLTGSGVSLETLKKFGGGQGSVAPTDVAVIGEPKPVFWGTCNLDPIVNSSASYFGMAAQADSVGSQGALCAGIMQHALGVGPFIKYMDQPASGRLNAAAGKYGQVSAYSANYSQTGLFGFLGMCEPKNLTSMVSAARDEMTKALTDGLTQEEFNRGKAQYLSSLSFQAEDTLGEAIRITDALLAGQKNPTNPIADLEKITLQDVNAWGKKMAGNMSKVAVAGTGNLADIGGLNLVK